MPDVCPPDEIVAHFKAHFNPDDPSKSSTPEELGENNLPSFLDELQNISRRCAINNEPPDVEEIQKHLKALKVNKASNDIDPEILKRCEHPAMLKIIHRMTTQLWTEIDIPSAWENSRLKTLWKGKGKKKEPAKHRGLSIGSTVCKLIINLILERLRSWYEAQLTDEQNGFRTDRGTPDGIYTTKRVQQITNRKKQPLYLLFVDLTAAFDHIPRKWLFDTIRLRFPKGEYPKLFVILEKLYSNTTLTYEEANEIFVTTSGVRQGGPESPPLFNLYIDFVMRVFLERCMKDKDIQFFNFKYRFNSRTVTRQERFKSRECNQKTEGSCNLPWCGYADDLILFLLDQVGLQKATCMLDEVFRSFGLTINASKTKSMILNYKYLSSEEYPESIVTLNDLSLGNVKEFKYLGSYLHHEQPNTGEVELNHRIQLANSKFAELMNLLQNHKIHLRTRVKFMDSYVRSRLTYACQNWNLNQTQFDRLDVCYRRFLRRMIRGGFKRKEGESNEFSLKINNAKLHRLCGTRDVSHFIQEQQCNYAAHIVRTASDRSTKKLMFNTDKYTKAGRTIPTLLEQAASSRNCTIDGFCNYAMAKKGNCDVT